MTRLHLLVLCRLAIQLAHWRCPPPLPAGPGGRPQRYRAESLLLLALLRTLWQLSYQDLHDWLVNWPALALACGLPLDTQGKPRVPSPSQQWKQAAHAGAPVAEALLIVVARLTRHRRLFGARDLIVDSAPILAWRRADRDAAVGHAPTIIPARSCVATAFIRSCVAAPGCRSSSCSRPPTVTTLRSPVRSWPERFDSTGCIRASCGWTTPGIGAYA